MRLQILVTLTIFSFALLFGQAMAAGTDNNFSMMENTIQSSTERGLTPTAMQDRYADTQNVRGYFGQAEYDMERTIESSRERGLETYADRDRVEDARPYFGEPAKEATQLNIGDTVESSREDGGLK
jgi:hypothetical protein